MGKQNKVKRIISFSAAAIVMLSSLKIAPASEIEAIAASGMAASQITQEMKIGWNLGNTFDAYDDYNHSKGLALETYWNGAKTTRELIHALKSAGFNLRMLALLLNSIFGLFVKYNPLEHVSFEPSF